MNTQTRTALMHQQDQPEDCVNAAAKELGMQIRWQGEGVEEKGYLPSPASGGGAGAARDLADVFGQPSRLAGSSIREGEKCIVAVDPRYFRPTEVETLLGDPSKAKAKLDWMPKITFDELVAEMVREDLKAAVRDELVKKHGYKAMDYNE